MHPKLFYRRGVAQEHLGNVAAAREDYERAHELNPTSLTEKALSRLIVRNLTPESASTSVRCIPGLLLHVFRLLLVLAYGLRTIRK